MTAPNHAVTGAVIGLTIGSPEIALPLAFLSHFVCDAIPHYDAAGSTTGRLLSKRFISEQIVAGGLVCFLIVLLLALSRPAHWFAACIAAFLAASPDLLWIPRFISTRRSGHDIDMKQANLFWRFHDGIQWKTGPRYIIVEAFWFGLFGSLVLAHL